MAGLAAGLSAVRGDREARQDSELFSGSIGLCKAWGLEHGGSPKCRVPGGTAADLEEETGGTVSGVEGAGYLRILSFTHPQLWHLLTGVRSWLNGLVSLPVHQFMPGFIRYREGPGFGRRERRACLYSCGTQLVGWCDAKSPQSEDVLSSPSHHMAPGALPSPLTPARLRRGAPFET